MRDRLRRSDQMQARKHRPDYWLLILSLALLVVGVIVVYSISPALGKAHNVSSEYFVAKQGIAIGIGLIVFFITSRIPTHYWRRLAGPLVIGALVATLVALLMPVDPAYPAHRWIRFGGFSIQSVELLKFALLIWLAGMLADRMNGGVIQDANRTLKPLMVVLLGVAFVVAGLQSDLGSMAVIVALMGAMAFVAGLPMRRLALIGVAILLLGTLAVSTTPYRRERLATFLHPASDCQSAGSYQACQALIAVGSGGVVGLGLGGSVQAYGYLPEAANDSIFAIYAEKFGFVGVAVLLAILATFFARLKGLAERAPDHFSRLLIMGIVAWLAVQTIINIGAMLGLLPLKGITLPLVSYGGTSVIFVMAALGVVFQISRYTTHVVQAGTVTGGGGGIAATRAGGRASGGAGYAGSTGMGNGGGSIGAFNRRSIERNRANVSKRAGAPRGGLR